MIFFFILLVLLFVCMHGFVLFSWSRLIVVVLLLILRLTVTFLLHYFPANFVTHNPSLYELYLEVNLPCKVFSSLSTDVGRRQDWLWDCPSLPTRVNIPKFILPYLF